jgi:hypothetical protein
MTRRTRCFCRPIVAWHVGRCGVGLRRRCRRQCVRPAAFAIIETHSSCGQGTISIRRQRVGPDIAGIEIGVLRHAEVRCVTVCDDRPDGVCEHSIGLFTPSVGPQRRFWGTAQTSPRSRTAGPSIGRSVRHAYDQLQSTPSALRGPHPACLQRSPRALPQHCERPRFAARLLPDQRMHHPRVQGPKAGSWVHASGPSNAHDRVRAHRRAGTKPPRERRLGDRPYPPLRAGGGSRLGRDGCDADYKGAAWSLLLENPERSGSAEDCR